MTDYPITDEAVEAATRASYTDALPWENVSSSYQEIRRKEARAAIRAFLAAEEFVYEERGKSDGRGAWGSDGTIECEPETRDRRLVSKWTRTPTEEENPKTRLRSYDGTTTGRGG